MNRSTILGVLAALAATAAHTSARAQAQEPGSFTAERFAPAIDANGIMGIEWGDVGNHLEYDAGLWLGYARNPLMLYRTNPDGSVDRAGALVSDRIGMSFVGGVTLTDWVKVGLELPFTLYQGRGGGLTEAGAQVEGLSAAGMGDVRLVVKTRLLRTDRHGLDVAFLPSFTAPSGLPRDSYLGESGLTFSPGFAVSRSVAGVRLAANFAYRMRSETELLDLSVGPEITYGVGAAMDVGLLAGRSIELAASLMGATPASTPFEDFNSNPLELDLGASFEASPGLLVTAGAGLGLVAGWGTPDARLFVGLRYSPRAPDRDHDRVADADDACIATPEDPDGFEDDDGCPDNDNDRDGIADASDACPDEPEVINDETDEDGCPDAGPSQVKMGLARIDIDETVYFETGLATIQARSHRLLRQVARIIKANPQITKVRIEGHTDDRGDDDVNLKLSQARAESVRAFLVGRGVGGDILEATGYGEQKPIADNQSERGRDRNRRVEFVIVEVDGHPIASKD